MCVERIRERLTACGRSLTLRQQGPATSEFVLVSVKPLRGDTNKGSAVPYLVMRLSDFLKSAFI